MQTPDYVDDLDSPITTITAITEEQMNAAIRTATLRGRHVHLVRPNEPGVHPYCMYGYPECADEPAPPPGEATYVAMARTRALRRVLEMVRSGRWWTISAHESMAAHVARSLDEMSGAVYFLDDGQGEVGKVVGTHGGTAALRLMAERRTSSRDGGARDLTAAVPKTTSLDVLQIALGCQIPDDKDLVFPAAECPPRSWSTLVADALSDPQPIQFP